MTDVLHNFDLRQKCAPKKSLLAMIMICPLLDFSNEPSVSSRTIRGTRRVALAATCGQGQKISDLQGFVEKSESDDSGGVSEQR